MSYTKGPWRLENGMILGADGRAVAFSDSKEDVLFVQDDDESIALAATELFEALCAMIDEFRQLDLPYGSEAYAMAISARNKAQGHNNA